MCIYYPHPIITNQYEIYHLAGENCDSRAPDWRRALQLIEMEAPQTLNENVNPCTLIKQLFL